MSCDLPGQSPTRFRDGREWQIGGISEVAWITEGTHVGRTISAAIPPVFSAYATVAFPHPEDGLDRPAREMDWTQYLAEWRQVATERHEAALLEALVQQSHIQEWWLGYLDTHVGVDTVFPDAPTVWVYNSSWRYVLVSAGPEQAGTWRDSGLNLALPDLIFPADRSWLLCSGWDDDWTSIGGPTGLVHRLLTDSLLGPRTNQVEADEDIVRSRS